MTVSGLTMTSAVRHPIGRNFNGRNKNELFSNHRLCTQWDVEKFTIK
jgi:hypothetical protein